MVASGARQQRCSSCKREGAASGRGTPHVTRAVVGNELGGRRSGQPGAAIAAGHCAGRSGIGRAVDRSKAGGCREKSSLTRPPAKLSRFGKARRKDPRSGGTRKDTATDAQRTAAGVESSAIGGIPSAILGKRDAIARGNGATKIF